MFLLVFSTIMNAQTDKIKISGKVVDNSGLAIPNASVSVDGNNTVTDIDGKYTVVANSAKKVKTYEAETYLGALEKIKEDHKTGFRLKYIRDLDHDNGHMYREAIGNTGSYDFK